MKSQMKPKQYIHYIKLNRRECKCSFYITDSDPLNFSFKIIIPYRFRTYVFQCDKDHPFIRIENSSKNGRNATKDIFNMMFEALTNPNSSDDVSIDRSSESKLAKAHFQRIRSGGAFGSMESDLDNGLSINNKDDGPLTSTSCFFTSDCESVADVKPEPEKETDCLVLKVVYRVSGNSTVFWLVLEPVGQGEGGLYMKNEDGDVYVKNRDGVLHLTANKQDLENGKTNDHETKVGKINERLTQSPKIRKQDDSPKPNGRKHTEDSNFSDSIQHSLSPSKNRKNTFHKTPRQLKAHHTLKDCHAQIPFSLLKTPEIQADPHELHDMEKHRPDYEWERYLDHSIQQSFDTPNHSPIFDRSFVKQHHTDHDEPLTPANYSYHTNFEALSNLISKQGNEIENQQLEIEKLKGIIDMLRDELMVTANRQKEQQSCIQDLYKSLQAGKS